MVALANTTRHNLLSFKFVHGIFLLVMGIQVLQEETPQLKRVVPSTCRLIHNNVQQHTNVNTRLFARNESHEHIISDCGGSRVWTRGIELRVAKFFPVLREKRAVNCQSSSFQKRTPYSTKFNLETFLLAMAFEIFLVSILKVRTIYMGGKCSKS